MPEQTTINPNIAAPVAEKILGPMTHYRWTICALLFVATTINYMDRQVIGILKPTLSDHFGWSESDYSRIVMCFSGAYAAGYLLVGRLMDLIGVRWGLSLAVAVWSLFGMGHAFASTVAGFGFARAGLGLSEGGNFPASIKTVSEWFPKKERALATGIFNAGSNVGALLTPILVPWLVERYDWRAAFFVTGALGFIWLVLWFILYGDPHAHRRVNQAERAHIMLDPPDPPVKIPWLMLLKHRQTWVFLVGTSLGSPIWWFYLYWVPGFLYKTYGLNLVQMMGPLVTIYLMTDVGSVGGGWLSSHLIHRGWSINAGRKTAMLVCAFCVVPIFLAAKLDPTKVMALGSTTVHYNLWLAVFLIGLAASAHQGFSANLFTLVSDTVPRKAVSSVIGIGGMAGALASMPVQWFTGLVLDKAPVAGYVILFTIASTAYLFNLLIIHLINPRHEPMNLRLPDAP
ncbi:MAG: MFS transporter [bacterium]|nr:MFS transporter [bacterium]